MMTGIYTPAPPVKDDFFYWVVDHQGQPLSHHDTFEEAKELANAAGKAIATRDTADGELRLTGADPLVRHLLGSRVHCMASFRTAVRSVITLWASKQDREDYLDFAGGRRGVPGWKTYRALDRKIRRVLMTWVALIHAEHRRTYVAVMSGRL